MKIFIVKEMKQDRYLITKGGWNLGRIKRPIVIGDVVKISLKLRRYINHLCIHPTYPTHPDRFFRLLII